MEITTRKRLEEMLKGSKKVVTNINPGEYFRKNYTVKVVGAGYWSIERR